MTEFSFIFWLSHSHSHTHTHAHSHALSVVFATFCSPIAQKAAVVACVCDHTFLLILKNLSCSNQDSQVIVVVVAKKKWGTFVKALHPRTSWPNVTSREVCTLQLSKFYTPFRFVTTKLVVASLNECNCPVFYFELVSVLLLLDR